MCILFWGNCGIFEKNELEIVWEVEYSWENSFCFMLYIVFAFILGILSVVLKKKHTQFPDFRVGYHNKKIMEN